MGFASMHLSYNTHQLPSLKCAGRMLIRSYSNYTTKGYNYFNAMHVFKSKSYEELGRTNSFSLIDFTKFAHTQNKNFKKENLYKAKVAQVNSKLIVQLRFTFPNGNCTPVEKRLHSTTALVSLVTIADQAVSLYQPAVFHHLPKQCNTCCPQNRQVTPSQSFSATKSFEQSPNAPICLTV